MPDRFLEDMAAGEPPSDASVQQLIEAESGRGAQGIARRWQASDSSRVVLTSDAAGVKISRDNGTTAPAQVIVDGTTAGGALTGTYPSPTLAAATINALIPPGTIWAFARDVVPTAGWALCQGQAVSRAANPLLFAMISTFYGVGDGSTTFNLPDLRGRVILMASGAHPLTQAGGAESVAGPAHTHPGQHSHGMNAHTHGMGHDHTMDHTHTLSSHTHNTDINHDHLLAPAAAVASGSTLNGRFAVGGVNALPDNHTHDVNLPALGTASTASGGPNAPNTSTGGTSTATALTTTTATGIPSNPDTEPTNSAPAETASTVATMPPFLSLGYIIRLG